MRDVFFLRGGGRMLLGWNVLGREAGGGVKTEGVNGVVEQSSVWVVYVWEIIVVSFFFIIAQRACGVVGSEFERLKNILYDEN